MCCDIMHQQHTVWDNNYIAENGLRRSKSLKVFADQMDNIWLYGQGTLMMFNKNTNQWNTTIGNELGLTGVSVDHIVNGMAGDRNGNIWIGTDRIGLLRMNVNTHEIEHVPPRNFNNQQNISQEDIGVQSLYVDDTDLLWVGTEKSGVAYYGTNIYKFEADMIGDVTSIAEWYERQGYHQLRRTVGQSNSDLHGHNA